MTSADTMQPMLRFLELDDGRNVHAQWMGPWPPPERFYVLRGRQSGMTKIWPGDEPLPDGWQEAAAAPSIDSFVYERASYSQITDEQISEMSHVMRGAEYRRVEEGGES